MELILWIFAFGSAIIALVQAYRFYCQMMTADQGTPRMIEIAEAVRKGARAYLNQQNLVVSIAFLVIAGLLAVAAFGFELQSRFVPFAFLTGGLFSGMSGWFGMRTATQASSRTAAAVNKSLNEGLQVAFRSGAVMGLTVVGLGLLYVTVWFAVLYWIMPAMFDMSMSLEHITAAMLCFGMGASAQALFARVGGGIFTKAADVGADLVGKVESNLNEDSPYNPATIADNVGDNVGDVAGMGADLYESYCGSILASASLGVAAFASQSLFGDIDEITRMAYQFRAAILPMLIAAVGILLSISGIYLVKTNDDASQKNLLKALGFGINVSTFGVCVIVVALVWLVLPVIPGTVWLGFLPGIACSVIVGLLAGWSIGKYTEYATSDEFSPTKKLAATAEKGAAPIIIGGIADGMMSVWAPVLIVCAATIGAFFFAVGGDINDPQMFSLGLYGVGIAAVGMLSTLGITLATDAYGPIADNAGGNAVMAELDPTVRQRTDALDSLGNTTAATGKGFAIGSAALTALALLAAYVEEVRIGIDRWAESAAVSVADDGLYRLSPGIVMHKGSEQTTTYLAMPSQTRDKRISDAWQKVDFRGEPAAIPNDLMTIAQPESDDDTASVKFVSTGAELIPVRRATLPEFTEFYSATVMNPRVLIGMFIGAMATFVFCAYTMKSVARAASGMVDEVRRQIKEKPGILDGSEKPDYERPVSISTRAAQKEMILPSLLGLATPVITGLLFGVGGVLGMLAGSLTSGFCVAIFMSNAGGSWDNAKKFIESGEIGGKNSEAHKAAVVGDTVGDPFKDTSGPALNILIKLMSIVSVVVASTVVRYSLVSLGWM